MEYITTHHTELTTLLVQHTIEQNNTKRFWMQIEVSRSLNNKAIE